MPNLGIRTVLAGMGVDYRSSAGEKILRYVELLARWNRRVNLVSSTRTDVLTPLIQESIWAAGQYPAEFRVHLDIGSGAGFPAIPLAATHPDVEITMVERRERKAAFLQTAVYDLKLNNVRIANERLEDTLRRSHTPAIWDCISWKAVILGVRDLKSIFQITGKDVRFWVFHGKELPVGDPLVFRESMELTRREECPFHPGWFLSEFRRRTVSRETG